MVLPDGMTPFSMEQPAVPSIGDTPSIPITLRAIMDHVAPMANGSAEGKSVIEWFFPWLHLSHRHTRLLLWFYHRTTILNHTFWHRGGGKQVVFSGPRGQCPSIGSSDAWLCQDPRVSFFPVYLCP